MSASNWFVAITSFLEKCRNRCQLMNKATDELFAHELCFSNYWFQQFEKTNVPILFVIAQVWARILRNVPNNCSVNCNVLYIWKLSHICSRSDFWCENAPEASRSRTVKWNLMNSNWLGAEMPAETVFRKPNWKFARRSAQELIWEINHSNAKQAMESRSVLEKCAFKHHRLTKHMNGGSPFQPRT